MQHLAGHVGRVVAREEHGAGCDFIGLAGATERHVGPESLHLSFGKVAGMRGVQINPGATALTRIARFITACATESVKETIAPFVDE